VYHFVTKQIGLLTMPLRYRVLERYYQNSKNMHARESPIFLSRYCTEIFSSISAIRLSDVINSSKRNRKPLEFAMIFCGLERRHAAGTIWVSWRGILSMFVRMIPQQCCSKSSKIGNRTSACATSAQQVLPSWELLDFVRHSPRTVGAALSNTTG